MWKLFTPPHVTFLHVLPDCRCSGDVVWYSRVFSFILWEKEIQLRFIFNCEVLVFLYSSVCFFFFQSSWLPKVLYRFLAYPFSPFFSPPNLCRDVLYSVGNIHFPFLSYFCFESISKSKEKFGFPWREYQIWKLKEENGEDSFKWAAFCIFSCLCYLPMSEPRRVFLGAHNIRKPLTGSQGAFVICIFAFTSKYSPL